MKHHRVHSSLVTVGIPTYVGGESLVKTVRSLLASTGVDPFPIVVSVDGNPLAPPIVKKLTNSRVTIIENRRREGQVARIREIIRQCRTPYLVLAQDDLLFDRQAIAHILRNFRLDPNLTMQAAEGRPLPPTTWFEQVVHCGFRIARRIEKEWNGGQNYLNACGRCIAFKTDVAHRLDVQSEVMSCDVHFYFMNRALGGTFRRAERAIYYYRSPKTLQDHLKQSLKHQAVPVELLRFRGIDLSKEAPIPKGLFLWSFQREWLRHPLWTTLYGFLLLYTRLPRPNPYAEKTRFWETDTSTKEL